MQSEGTPYSLPAGTLSFIIVYASNYWGRYNDKWLTTTATVGALLGVIFVLAAAVGQSSSSNGKIILRARKT